MTSRGPTPEKRRKPSLPPIIGTVLFALMPYLVWHGTWFGRRLGNDELSRYLKDTGHSRHIQHALFQMAERMDNGDSTVKTWYPDMIQASRNPQIEVRTVAAWAMGHDRSSEPLHTALLSLLHDPEALVRWNAALSLVKIGDDRGHDEIVGILQPYSVQARQPGTLTAQVRAGQDVERGTVLATIRTEDGRDTQVKSPFPGRVESVKTSSGSRVASGSPVVALRAAEDEVWEALRGLYLVGRPGDLAAVESIQGNAGASERTRQQAAITARAIRTRMEPSPSR